MYSLKKERKRKESYPVRVSYHSGGYPRNRPEYDATIRSQQLKTKAEYHNSMGVEKRGGV